MPPQVRHCQWCLLVLSRMNGAHFCQHCDRGCVGAKSCLSCRAVFAHYRPPATPPRKEEQP